MTGLFSGTKESKGSIYQSIKSAFVTTNLKSISFTP